MVGTGTLGDVALRLELLDLPPLTEAADHVGDRDVGVRVGAVLERAIAIDVVKSRVVV